MQKDWSGNNVSVFSNLGARNCAIGEREKNDYYATDPIAIDKLFAVEEFDNNIWECACGEGNLSKRMKEYNKNVKSTDLIDRKYQDELVDFLLYKGTFDGDIITNPPYKYVTEFILKSLEVIGEGRKVAMFLKLQHLEGKRRYEEIYSKYPPKTVYVVSSRIQCAKNNEFKKGNGAIAYCWFVWQKGFKGEPIIRWI